MMVCPRSSIPSPPLRQQTSTTASALTTAGPRAGRGHTGRDWSETEAGLQGNRVSAGRSRASPNPSRPPAAVPLSMMICLRAHSQSSVPCRASAACVPACIWRVADFGYTRPESGVRPDQRTQPAAQPPGRSPALLIRVLTSDEPTTTTPPASPSAARCSPGEHAC